MHYMIPIMALMVVILIMHIMSTRETECSFRKGIDVQKPIEFPGDEYNASYVSLHNFCERLFMVSFAEPNGVGIF